MKLLPRTMAGQLLALLLFALIVAHLVAVLLLSWLRNDNDEVHPLSAHTIETRVAAAYRAIEGSPESAERLVQSISLPESQFRIRPAPAVDGGALSAQEALLLRGLRQRLDLPSDIPIHVSLRRWPLEQAEADEGAVLALLSAPLDEVPGRVLRVDLRLPDGRWLSSWHLPTMLLSHWSRVLSFSVPVGVLPIILIAVLFGRRIMQPMKMLTEAAQRISRG